MLYYDRIDASERIDVKINQTDRKNVYYHYWYFLDTGYKCESDVCNGCHDGF